MKVSVFIPAYNVENYISASIESILKQSYENWELVIVDDCSSDNTYDICKSYELKDKRIKVFRNEQNLGMMANWVHGIAYCSGEYWGKLDADDIWEEHMLSECVYILDSNPDVGLVVTNYINIDEQGNVIPGSEYVFPDFASDKAISLVPFVKAGIANMFSHHIAQQGIGLLRRRIFEELGNFTLLPAGDTEMWFRIGAHYKIYCRNRLMHYHRVWPNNFTRTQVLNTNRRDKNLYDVRKAIFNYYFEKKIITPKLYHLLKNENEFEFNKVNIHISIKERNIAKGLSLVCYNLWLFPLRTIRFYLKRLYSRFKGSELIQKN